MDYRKLWFDNNRSTLTGKYRCSHCRKKFKKKNIDIDHIVPRSRGGRDELGNLQALCRHCNRSKGNRMSQTRGDVKLLRGKHRRDSNYSKVKVPKTTDKFCFVCNNKVSVFLGIELSNSGIMCRDCYKQLASAYRRQRLYIGFHLRGRLDELNKTNVRQYIRLN